MLPFPLNYISPQRMRARAAAVVSDRSLEELSCEAQLCLEALEGLLGDDAFFFGEKPSYLDAVVYGYVAIVMNVPCNGDALQKPLSVAPRVVALYHRIHADYFDGGGTDKANMASGLPGAQQGISKNAASITVAIGAMVCYGISTFLSAALKAK